MSNWGDVVFSCRKCGKVITRPSGKRRELFSCGACRTVQRPPGIANQQQATAAQLTIIQRQFHRHLLGFIVAPCVVVIAIALSPIAMLVAHRFPDDSDLIMMSPPLLAFIGIFFLLCMELGSVECLGGSATTAFVLFWILWPVWVLRSIYSLVRLNFHLKRLRGLGPRS